MAAAEHKINLSTEDGHQYALMLWAQQASVRRRWPELALLYHVENERLCTPQQAARRKRMGVKKRRAGSLPAGSARALRRVVSGTEKAGRPPE